MPTLDDAIRTIKTGNKAEGRQILEELLDTDENNEEIWLWLSSVVDTDDDREICLENVLALDSENVVAQKGLESLRSGIFSTDDLLKELLVGEDDGYEEEPPATFLDDFVVSDDDDFDDDDDDLYSGQSEKSGGIKGKLNLKVLAIAGLAFVLVIVLVALGVAAMSLLGGDGGDDIQSGNPPTQEAPAGGIEPEVVSTPTTVPTPTSSPTPADTPTPKLRLPAATATKPPTPTATQVVSPTPIKN